MKPWIRRWGPAIIVMALIFIASSTPGRDIPSFNAWDTVVKKGGHMIGYALLATAYFYALTKGRSISRSSFLAAIGLAIIYAISDEWHQRFTAGRSPAVTDVCIDTAGALIGLAVSRLIHSRILRWKTAKS